METVIIISKKDIASLNIKDHLTKFNLNICTIEKESIYAENIDKEIKADLFIFATKHQSKTGIPSLSVHSPGNWSKAEFGGKDKTLCRAPASLLKTAFLEINKLKQDLNYEVVMEITHHGPFLEKPCMFIEIGSSSPQWKDKLAGEVIANAINNIVSKPTEKYRIALGIGGLHTCPNFNKILLNTDIALGHICPKYMLPHLTEDLISQAIEKTQEKVDFILLDWKGLGKEKQRVKEMLNNLNLEYKRTDKL